MSVCQSALGSVSGFWGFIVMLVGMAIVASCHESMMTIVAPRLMLLMLLLFCVCFLQTLTTTVVIVVHVAACLYGCKNVRMLVCICIRTQHLNQPNDRPSN